MPKKLIGKDIDIVRRMFIEATQSVGVEARYFEVIKQTEDFYNDPDRTYRAPYTLDIIFEDNPKVKVMKEFGWYTEDEEIRPVLLYLPIYRDNQKNVLKVHEGSLVEICYGGIQELTALFKISAKRMDSTYGLFWICKAHAERVTKFEQNLDDGYYYLSTERQIVSRDKIHLKSDMGDKSLDSSDTVKTKDVSKFFPDFDFSEESDDYSSSIMGGYKSE